MKETRMRKAISKSLTDAQANELAALAAKPDDQIDTDDIPEQQDWTGAQRGVFFRPVKTQLTLRLDADLVAWFKSHATEGAGYQTRINNALRTYVAERERGSR